MKLQFNSEDLWTKACRHMLTNLKWGLAFVGMKFLKREGATSTAGSTPSPSTGPADPEETSLSRRSDSKVRMVKKCRTKLKAL